MHETMSPTEQALAAVTSALAGMLDGDPVDELLQDLLDDVVDLTGARQGFLAECGRSGQPASAQPRRGDGEGDASVRVVARVGERPTQAVLDLVPAALARGRESVSDAYAFMPLVDADQPVGVLAVGAESRDDAVSTVGSLEPYALTCAALLRSRRMATEREASQAALHRERSLLQDVADNSFAVIFVKDPDGRYLLVNRQFEKVVEVTRDQALGHTDHDILPGDVAEALRANDRLVLDSGDGLEFEEVVPYRGEPRTYTSVKFPLRARDGSTYAVCGIATDVTDQRRAEERFRAMAGLVEASTDFIALADIQGVVRYLNPAGRELVGLQGPVDQRSIPDFIPPHLHGRFEHEVLPALLGGTWSGEFEVRHQVTGESILVMANAFSVRDPEKGETVALGAVARDLREDRRAEADRKQLEQQLAQAQRLESVGRLAGGVAHDFNNLLTVIVNYADLLLAELADPALRTEAEQIRSSAEKASTLTRQLLLFSRRTVVKPEVVRPDAVVEGLGHLLRRTLGEDIVLRTEYDPDTPYVEIDPTGLEQVVVNLAVNARDAMPDGGTLTIRTRRVRGRGSDGAGQPASPAWLAELTVTDTGEGMPDEVTAQAFEPFFTTKEPGRGTGLGLASVHGIVEQAGGHVRIESAEGRGTAVTVELPARRPVVDTKGSRDAGSPPGGHGETVLVVEDDVSVRTLTVRVLGRNGYEVLEAAGPQEALDLLSRRREAPDLLLTDVVMPGMSGTELAERVVAEHPGTSVVFMSGYPRDALGERLSHDTVLLDKPFTVEGLLAVVRAQLGAAPRG